MSGTSYLTGEVFGYLYRKSPIGYFGDGNLAGTHIAANAERVLRAAGWKGEWTLLAVTPADFDAVDPAARISKLDGRYDPPKLIESVEAEALGTTKLRKRLTDFLDALLPAGFTWAAHDAAVEAKRGLLRTALEPLRTRTSRRDDLVAAPDEMDWDDDESVEDGDGDE